MKKKKFSLKKNEQNQNSIKNSSFPIHLFSLKNTELCWRYVVTIS